MMTTLLYFRMYYFFIFCILTFKHSILRKGIYKEAGNIYQFLITTNLCLHFLSTRGFPCTLLLLRAAERPSSPHKPFLFVCLFS